MPCTMEKKNTGLEVLYEFKECKLFQMEGNDHCQPFFILTVFVAVMGYRRSTRGQWGYSLVGRSGVPNGTQLSSSNLPSWRERTFENNHCNVLKSELMRGSSFYHVRVISSYFSVYWSGCRERGMKRNFVKRNCIVYRDKSSLEEKTHLFLWEYNHEGVELGRVESLLFYLSDILRNAQIFFLISALINRRGTDLDRSTTKNNISEVLKARRKKIWTIEMIWWSLDLRPFAYWQTRQLQLACIS